MEKKSEGCNHSTVQSIAFVLFSSGYNFMSI